jgi:hypothetical protein
MGEDEAIEQWGAGVFQHLADADLIEVEDGIVQLTDLGRFYVVITRGLFPNRAVR